MQSNGNTPSILCYFVFVFKILKTTEAETLIYFYIKSISAIIVIL